MGGWGSGRNRYASTPTVGDCYNLDVDELIELTEYPGSDGKLQWGDEAEIEATIGVTTEGTTTVDGDPRAAALRLYYRVTDPRRDESREVSYRVPLEYTECHFGGARPWFQCPTCRDRRRKLDRKSVV